MGVRNRHFRSVVSLVVAVVLIIAISYLGVHTLRASHAATGASLYLTPDSATINSGATMSVTVREMSGSDLVNSVQAAIGYDPAAFQYVGLTEGTTFGVAAATQTSTPGVIRIARATSGGGVSGDNPVITINFKVVGTSAGATKLNFDRANSYLVRGSDNSDILQSVGAGSFAISGKTVASTPGGMNSGPTTSSTDGTGVPTLKLDPATGTYGPGSTIAVAVNLKAFATPVTTVEATVSYPASQLQYLGVAEGNGFVVRQRTATRNGVLDIIRGISGGSSGLKGDNTIVTLSFKVIGTSGDAAVSFITGSAVYDNSGTGTNVLDLASSTGAKYTVSASAPVTTAVTTPNVPTTSIASPAQAATIRSSGRSGTVSLVTSGAGAVFAQVTGQVNLSPMIDQSVYAAGAPYTVKKVEYYVDSKLVHTSSAKPYDYRLDSAALRNGSYALVVRTYYTNGVVDARSDTLLVRNPVTPWYVVRHYTPAVVGIVAILIATLVLIIKVLLPRRQRRHAELIKQGIDPDLRGFGAGPTAADPLVVKPVGSTAPVDLLPISTNAVAETAALPFASSSESSSNIVPTLSEPIQPVQSYQPAQTSQIDGSTYNSPQSAIPTPQYSAAAPINSSTPLSQIQPTPSRQIPVHMIDDAPVQPTSNYFHT